MNENTICKPGAPGAKQTYSSSVNDPDPGGYNVSWQTGPQDREPMFRESFSVGKKETSTASVSTLCWDNEVCASPQVSWGYCSSHNNDELHLSTCCGPGTVPSTSHTLQHSFHLILTTNLQGRNYYYPLASKPGSKTSRVYLAPTAWLVSDNGQIQLQVVWALTLFSSYPLSTLPLFMYDRLIFPTMIPSLEGWTKFCTYVNRCLSTEILVWPELVLCAWLVRACKHPLGFSKAESKQSEPQVHLASFCSLLLPGLSPVSLTSALCCPHHCHPQPMPFPLSHLPWICPPTCLQAQFLPGLATLLTEAGRGQSAHLAQQSCGPSFTSHLCPNFVFTAIFHLHQLLAPHSLGSSK